MKCEHCGKRLKTMLGSTKLPFEGRSIQVNNIPVLVCPDCGSEIFHDIILERARQYICQYGAQGGQIDFGTCEQREAGDTIVTMQTLGLM